MEKTLTTVMYIYLQGKRNTEEITSKKYHLVRQNHDDPHSPFSFRADWVELVSNCKFEAYNQSEEQR